MENAYQITLRETNTERIYGDEILWSEIKARMIKICECSKHIMVCIFDIKKKVFLSCSNSFESILGYTPCELRKGGWKFWYNLMDPRETEVIRKRITSFIFATNSLNNSAIYLNYHLRTSTGAWRFIKHELELFKMNGEYFALSYLYDFSEKERIEQCLGKKSEVPNFKNSLGVDISSRECEVLKLIANGFSSKQIAHKLFISDHTAISHRKNLIEKFRVNNTAQLIKRASQLIRL